MKYHRPPIPTHSPLFIIILTFLRSFLFLSSTQMFIQNEKAKWQQMSSATQFFQRTERAKLLTISFSSALLFPGFLSSKRVPRKWGVAFQVTPLCLGIGNKHRDKHRLYRWREYQVVGPFWELIFGQRYQKALKIYVSLCPAVWLRDLPCRKSARSMLDEKTAPSFSLISKYLHPSWAMATNHSSVKQWSLVLS